MVGQKTFLPKMNRVTSLLVDLPEPNSHQESGMAAGAKAGYRLQLPADPARGLPIPPLPICSRRLCSPLPAKGQIQVFLGPEVGLLITYPERDGWEPWRRNGLLKRNGCRPSKRRRSAAPDFRALLARVVVGSAPRTEKGAGVAPSCPPGLRGWTRTIPTLRGRQWSPRPGKRCRRPCARS